MPFSSILEFWVVALLLIVVPGADWAFTVSSALGGRSVLPAVGGLILGYAAMTLVVAAGVGAVVAQSAGILTGLTMVGGAYLIWHGVMTVARPSAPGVVADGNTTSPWRMVWKGAGVSGLNPKGLLIFVALLPQFANPRASWPFAVQIGALGLAFIVTCAIFYAALGRFSQTVLRARPAAARAVSRLSGVAMIAIGALIMVDRLAS